MLRYARLCGALFFGKASCSPDSILILSGEILHDDEDVLVNDVQVFIPVPDEADYLKKEELEIGIGNFISPIS